MKLHDIDMVLGVTSIMYPVYTGPDNMKTQAEYVMECARAIFRNIPNGIFFTVRRHYFLYILAPIIL